jgi:hypothetical protein
MIGYVVKRTGKTYKKKLGFMKSKTGEIVVIDHLDDPNTLSRFTGEIKRHVKNRYGKIPSGPQVERKKLIRIQRRVHTQLHRYREP